MIAGQSMIFGLAINLEEHTSAELRLIVQSTVLAGALVVMALLGPPLFRNALAALRNRKVTIEALFLLTMMGALAASLQSLITGRGPIYFEVVSILLVVYSLGKAIGAHSRASALAAVGRWSKSLSRCRLIDRVGQQIEVDVEDVMPGQVIEVRPGDLITVDGTICSGVGYIGEAPVTGEPFAVVRRPGDFVLAGMASFDATFHVQVVRAGRQRQVDRLLRSVEEAKAGPSSLQSRADRLGRLFFPFVVAVALATLAFWWWTSGWEAGLFNAMSVLLVACPCALGLATPIVFWSALNRLAERGLVLNSAEVIEGLANVDLVYFDKTGTLTEDRYALLDIATLVEGEPRANLLRLLALVQSQSDHPVAMPFKELLEADAGNGAPAVRSFAIRPGGGVEAVIENAGRHQRIRLGAPDWIGHGGTADEQELLERLSIKDGHRIDCEIDGSLGAIAIVAERLRDSATQTLQEMEALGLRTHVLTGDRSERAAALGLPRVQGNLLAEQKQHQILATRTAGRRPLMVGDGVNDASALAAAEVGIALSSGTELAGGAADGILYHHDLRVLPWAIALSREAVRTVRHSLMRAVAYNLAGMSMAACGILHPVVAALLMAFSSLWVAWSSVRVGVAAGDACGAGTCSTPTAEIPFNASAVKAGIHAIAFGLQGVILTLLLAVHGVMAGMVVVGFIVVGVIGARAWLRTRWLPRWLDMAYGMLTLGNLGMTLGWWADNGFAAFHNGCCCACIDPVREVLLQPWMWLGMLAAANAAMYLLGRQSHGRSMACGIAMFTGGNAGMAAGMLLGGWAACLIGFSDVAMAALADYVGMTLGMIGGMLLGTELCRRALDVFVPTDSFADAIVGQRAATANSRP